MSVLVLVLVLVLVMTDPRGDFCLLAFMGLLSFGVCFVEAM